MILFLPIILSIIFKPICTNPAVAAAVAAACNIRSLGVCCEPAAEHLVAEVAEAAAGVHLWILFFFSSSSSPSSAVLAS